MGWLHQSSFIKRKKINIISKKWHTGTWLKTTTKKPVSHLRTQLLDGIENGVHNLHTHTTTTKVSHLYTGVCITNSPSSTLTGPNLFSNSLCYTANDINYTIVTYTTLSVTHYTAITTAITYTILPINILIPSTLSEIRCYRIRATFDYLVKENKSKGQWNHPAL